MNITDYDEDEYIRLLINSEHTVLDKKVNLKVFPLKVHFKKELMAKIISFSDVCGNDDIRMIFNSHLRNHFDILLPSGQTCRNKQVNAKLFYFDIAVDSPLVYNVTNLGSNKSKSTVAKYPSLQTVNNNESRYNVKNIKR